MKILGISIASTLALILLVVSAYAIKYYTADVRGRVEANEIIKGGRNRISQYDHFFNLCAAIQTSENSIDATTQQLEATADQKDRSRLMTNLTAQKIQRASSINRYNADALKNYTSGQFRDSDLPYQISTAEYIPGGTKTRCAFQ